VLPVGGHSHNYQQQTTNQLTNIEDSNNIYYIDCFFFFLHKFLKAYYSTKMSTVSPMDIDDASTSTNNKNNNNNNKSQLPWVEKYRPNR
jgi:hypothetical protein